MRIMHRNAADDYFATLTANAMESAGAIVFAITPRGSETHPGALMPHVTYVVWAKVGNDSDIESVDIAIHNALEGN